MLEAARDGGKRGLQWQLGARMRIVHALWVSNGLVSLGPVLPFGGKAVQCFYEEIFCEEGLTPKTYQNRPGYAQVNLFKNLLARALLPDGTDRPYLRFVLQSVQQLASLTVPGTDIPAVLMESGLGWMRLLGLGGQRIESTGGAAAGGQHLDAAPSEKRKQRAEAHAQELRRIPSVRAGDVQFFVRCTSSIGAGNDSDWVSPSNHGDYSLCQSMPAGYGNGYAGHTRHTDPDGPNRNSHGGSASSALRVQYCFDTEVMHVPTVQSHFRRRALDWTLREVPPSLSSPFADGGDGDARRLRACTESDLSVGEQMQCFGWLATLPRPCGDSGVRCSALAALQASAASQPAVLRAISHHLRLPAAGEQQLSLLLAQAGPLAASTLTERPMAKDTVSTERKGAAAEMARQAGLQSNEAYVAMAQRTWPGAALCTLAAWQCALQRKCSASNGNLEELERVKRESTGIEQDQYMAACQAILAEAKDVEELGRGTEMVQPVDADGLAVGAPLSASALAGTSARAQLSLPAGAVGTVAAGTAFEVGQRNSSAHIVIDTLMQMQPTRLKPSLPVVLERMAKTQARLSLRNLPSVIERGLLGGFIRELASAYLSDDLRYSVLAEIRRKTSDASGLLLTLAALLGDLEQRPVNCTYSRKYLQGWLAALRSPPKETPSVWSHSPQMSSTVLDQKLWSGAFAAGWVGVQRGNDKRYWHTSSPKRLFRSKVDAMEYNGL